MVAERRSSRSRRRWWRPKAVPSKNVQPRASEEYNMSPCEDEDEEEKETKEDVLKKELKEERIRTGLVYEAMERQRRSDRHLLLA
eukprot:10181023-Karenia_brevis.AAC.1